MTTACLLILLGIALLCAGGEALVRGSASLALRLGIAPLVVGLTVVAFGTSTPELITSLRATLDGKGDIAIGNVIGANSFNIGVILGLTALICPLRAGMQILRFDVPVMVGVVALPVWFLWDGAVTRMEAGVLLALLIAYTFLIVRVARRAAASGEVKAGYAEGIAKPKAGPWLDLTLIAAGLAMLIFGSGYLVDGAVVIARHFGVGEAIIGLTIVAAGTSVPELAASLVAAFRKQPDIALGNIIGSNIYNILAIVGVSGAVQPIAAPGIAMLDIAVMITLSAALIPMLRSGMSLERWEGLSLLVGYGVYLWWLWPK